MLLAEEGDAEGDTGEYPVPTQANLPHLLSRDSMRPAVTGFGGHTFHSAGMCGLCS